MRGANLEKSRLRLRLLWMLRGVVVLASMSLLSGCGTPRKTDIDWRIPHKLSRDTSAKIWANDGVESSVIIPAGTVVIQVPTDVWHGPLPEGD